MTTSFNAPEIRASLMALCQSKTDHLLRACYLVESALADIADGYNALTGSKETSVITPEFLAWNHSLRDAHRSIHKALYVVDHEASCDDVQQQFAGMTTAAKPIRTLADSIGAALGADYDQGAPPLTINQLAQRFETRADWVQLAIGHLYWEGKLDMAGAVPPFDPFVTRLCWKEEDIL